MRCPHSASRGQRDGKASAAFCSSGHPCWKAFNASNSPGGAGIECVPAIGCGEMPSCIDQGAVPVPSNVSLQLGLLHGGWQSGWGDCSQHATETNCSYLFICEMIVLFLCVFVYIVCLESTCWINFLPGSGFSLSVTPSNSKWWDHNQEIR